MMVTVPWEARVANALPLHLPSPITAFASESGKNTLDDSPNFTVKFLISTAEIMVHPAYSASPVRRAQMPFDHQFGLFQDDDDRSIWRGSFADLDEARRQAQRWADEERQEFFVRRFADYSEVARLFPTRMNSQISRD